MNQVTKLIQVVLSAVMVSALAAGCAVGAAPESDGDQVDPPALETQSSGVLTETFYYSNPSHTTVVGRCVFSSCPPKGTHCWGTKTAYTEIYSDVCSY